MLAFVEKYLESIRKSRTDGDVVEILSEISSELGFRSAYLIEYTANLSGLQHVIDTNRDRSQWWKDYFTNGHRSDAKEIEAILQRGGVQTMTGERFKDPKDPILAFARKADLIEATVVPVSYGGVVVGVAGLSGVVELTAAQQTAVQLLVYSLFAQVRSFGSTGIFVPPDALTPREKEVIALSAEGLTSVEIAERLGMSARTVNQHVDNVADKLGTKNRTHTIAEVIRHGLLH
jgi:LuxR family transcriptional regulator, quorum-sensing system regulator BjaR1